MQWYEQRKVPARAAMAKHTPTPFELRKNQNRIGSSPFPPPSPREKAAKDAAYVAWLKTHAPRRHSRVGFEDDAEIGAAWSRSPQAGSQLYAGDKVKFFVDGKSLNGRIQQNSHKTGHLVIRATRQSGGLIHTSIPRNNVYAIDLKDRARRKDFNYPVGWSSPPSYGEVAIGCPCSDQGTLF